MLRLEYDCAWASDVLDVEAQWRKTLYLTVQSGCISRDMKCINNIVYFVPVYM